MQDIARRESCTEAAEGDGCELCAREKGAEASQFLEKLPEVVNPDTEAGPSKSNTCQQKPNISRHYMERNEREFSHV